MNKGWGKGGKGSTWGGGFGDSYGMDYGMDFGMGVPYPGKGGFGMDFGKGFGKGAGGAPKDAKGLVRNLVQTQVLPGGVGRWDNDESKTLFVGGLPEDMTDLEMYTIFAPFGAIAPRGANAMKNKETGKCTGIGFVNYIETASAQSAIRTLHGVQFSDGSWLTVKKKGPPKEKKGE
eukprot:TRINITY_DN25632_c0_g1_i1.p1 TRINITY_DN25632_c0_g1~~TRINITY_DN25632_c0_g1_i1.p1  ORF type:complete len:176 (-),score=50.34 TRINITY_DN25632_c0_g1_i1:186-713(-)